MRLFISYAHVDKPIVDDWIVSNLRAGHHDVWIDERLFAGQEWKQQLLKAIQDSQAIVYAITPESIASQVCQWEIAKAVELGKPIIPVLIQARTPIPGWLSSIQYVDFSNGPKGDVVAKLLGGLQQLSVGQVPLFPVSPQVAPAQNPPQPTDPIPPPKTSFMIKLLRDPAFQAVIAVISLLLAFVAFVLPMLQSQPTVSPTPTVSASLSTPATPIVEALRDLEIRSGPGAAFSRLNILFSGSTLDIMGISDDRLWYQVLLLDGTTGWILASSSGASLEGDRSVMRVIVPTITPTERPTETSVPTLPSTQTNTPIPTAPSTVTHTYTPVPPSTTTLPEIIETASATTVPLPTQGKAYPCEAQVNPNSNATTLNVVRQFPNQTAKIVYSVRRGDAVTVLERSAGAEAFYNIQSKGQTMGWIAAEYLVLSSKCP